MTTTQTAHIIEGITPEEIDKAERFIINQTPHADRVSSNSLHNTTKSVSVQSEVDNIHYVCRIFEFYANTMHYIFKMNVTTIYGHSKDVYLLDDPSNAMAYAGDELFNVFDAIANENGLDHSYMELYTDNIDVESDFRLWAEGKEEKEERPDFEDDFRY